MNQFQRIQLVVLSHNRPDRLPALFRELLLPACERGVQVTIVDNASESSLRQFLSQFARSPNLEIILNHQNLGVAKGRNLAFGRSKREFSVYLDDDSIMGLDTLESVPLVFDELPGAGILAFRVVHATTGETQNEHGNTRVMVGNFHGAGHAIRRALFDKIGYLDETCFFGAEELEFSMRALTSGMETIYSPEILVRHFNFERGGRDNFQRHFYWARNYAMVLFRYLPPPTACLFSLRLFVSHLASGFHKAQVRLLLLPFAMLHGSMRGVLSRNPLGTQGIAYYTDPKTRPELGNVSIVSKALNHLSSTAFGDSSSRRGSSAN